MSRQSRALISTDRQVGSARIPTEGRLIAEYRVAGTPNLVLRVTRSGRRGWTYWMKRVKTGHWQKYRIGPYPDISLARAREEVVRLRRAVLDGEDPFETRVAGRGKATLRALGETFIKRYAKPRKRSWAEDERKLKVDIDPALGNIRADLVTKSDIVGLLDAINDRGAPILANRTLSLIRKLLNWAVAEGYVERNPALGIPMRAKEEARTRVLSEDELRAFWHALGGPGFESVTADALKFQLLLGARIREVTHMSRAELALDQNPPLWVLPAARSKSGRATARPLPRLALAILQVRLDDTDSDFVFASPLNDELPISTRAPTRAVSRAATLGLVPAGFTPHDLRRTCRTLWAHLRIDETVAKKLLGHVPPRSDVTASVYDRHTYVPEMARALAKWERHLMSIVTKQNSVGW